MTGFRSSPFLILLLYSTLSLAQPEAEIDWHYEIDLLGKELVQRHSNLFFQKDSAYFFNAMNQIAEQSDRHSLFDISVQLQQVIAAMGDAQTRINYHFNIDPGSILPIELYWFEEGIYVLKCYKEHQSMLGHRLTAINGFPLEQIIDSLSTLLVNHNPFLCMAEIPGMLTWTPLLSYFGFSNGEDFSLDFVDDQGIRGSQTIRLSESGQEISSVQPSALPLGWQERSSYFRDLYMPERKIYYIQYNKCWSREVEEEFGSGASALFMPPFQEFEKQVFQTIRRTEIDKLVLDLRFNNGGNAAQGTEFIKKLSRARIRGHGHFYLITGRETFASAMINALDMITATEAVVVGEGTGGKPNHYGVVERFVLPESRLVVNCTSGYFKLLDEDPPSLLPDLEAPISFHQYTEGIDPAMEAIENHNR